jgi:single-stranded-DNA-specific exonuclease
LRTRIDNYARSRLSSADLEPVLNIDAELPLHSVSPELFEVLQMLEPFGAGHHEPVFCASAVRLAAAPRFLKEKHVRMKFCPNGEASRGWRRSLTYDSVGWRLAERVQNEHLLPGDDLDIAFTLGHNDHPELGGIELSLRDFRSRQRMTATGTAS